LLVFQCYAANSPKYQNKKALEDSVAWLRRQWLRNNNPKVHFRTVRYSHIKRTLSGYSLPWMRNHNSNDAPAISDVTNFSLANLTGQPLAGARKYGHAEAPAS
jgi:hypothetical protein